MFGRVQEFREVLQFITVQGLRSCLRQPSRASEIHRVAWYGGPTRLPQASVATLFPGIEQVTVSVIAPLSETGGNVWVQELVILDAVCRLLKPKRVFELGTFNGRTTVNLAANCPEDAIIYTLDIPHDHPAFAEVSGEERFRLKENAGALYRNSPYSSKVKQLWADSAEFDPEILLGQLDLAFIDGSHSYPYVKNDTQKVLKMMAPGGVVFWHDYYPQYPDVARYLEEQKWQLFHIETTSLVVLRNVPEGSV
jgi:predicted O-methyltransferase YrrM